MGGKLLNHADMSKYGKESYQKPKDHKGVGGNLLRWPTCVKTQNNFFENQSIIKKVCTNYYGHCHVEKRKKLLTKTYVS